MRARNIKPGFFKNDLLAELDPMARLLFIGLWCYADREGRFEVRVKKIKAEIFPYEDVDITCHLQALTCNGFVITYNDNGATYGQIANFRQHQRPHPHEAASQIPELNQCHCMSLTSREMSLTCPPDIRNDDIMISSTLSTPSGSIAPEQSDKEKPPQKKKRQKKTFETDEKFERFWSAYPRKIAKGQAKQTWKKIKPSEDLLVKILSTLEVAKKQDQWIRDGGQYIPYPSTWLNAEGWEDIFTIDCGKKEERCEL